MIMSLAIVVLSMGLSLLIATMAYLPLRGASIYRILLVWPYAISPAVAGIIFLLMFNPDRRHYQSLERQLVRSQTRLAQRSQSRPLDDHYGQRMEIDGL